MDYNLKLLIPGGDDTEIRFNDNNLLVTKLKMKMNKLSNGYS